MKTAALVQLIDHAEWADALVWKAVEGLSLAGPHPRLHHLLHHVHLVQRLYLQVWRSEPLTLSEATDFPDLASIRSWAVGFYPSAREHVASRDDRELERAVEFPWAATLAEAYGEVGQATLAESVLQVGLHTSHHRGQLSTLVRELGGTPPTSDFISWVWQGKPAAAWGSHADEGTSASGA